MLSLSKLESSEQDFLSFVGMGTRARSPLMTIAIGRCLSNLASLPSSLVDDPYEYYRMTILMGLREQLSKLNELVVVDVDNILDYAGRFYAFRYYSAFPKKSILCLSKETMVEDFTGLSSALEPVAISAIKESPLEFTKFCNGMTKVLDQLLKIDDNF